MGYISKSVATCLGKVFIPLYSALVRLYLECCVQFGGTWDKKGIDILERAQWRATRMVTKLHDMLCENRLRDLGLFSGEK